MEKHQPDMVQVLDLVLANRYMELCPKNPVGIYTLKDTRKLYCYVNIKSRRNE